MGFWKRFLSGDVRGEKGLWREGADRSSADEGAHSEHGESSP